MVSSRNQGSAPGRAARPGDFAARVFIARQFSARPGHAEFEKTYKKWKNYAKFWENETQKVKICKKNWKWQKWMNWRSRVKLKDFCKFWAHNRNLRWKLPYEKKFMSLRPYWNFRHLTWPVPKYSKNSFIFGRFEKNWNLQNLTP